MKNTKPTCDVCNNDGAVVKAMNCWYCVRCGKTFPFKKEPPTMTLTEYVEKQIVKLFEDVAAQVGNGEVLLDHYSEDEWAAIPMTIFEAQGYMIQCWHKFIMG